MSAKAAIPHIACVGYAIISYIDNDPVMKSCESSLSTYMISVLGTLSDEIATAVS